MSVATARMFVCVGQNSACVKITGRASFTSSIDFKTLLNELFGQGCIYILVDLTECSLMDSTFLGVLAGFGLKLSAPQPDHVERAMDLFNPNPRILELLENLGILQLFKVTQGDATLPNPSSTTEVETANPSREEVTRNCLEAHRTLMEIHPGNVSRFKDVTQFLAEKLKRSG